ncbi:hypothetical protein FRB99_004464, partial [Tulasnella sp. 403]
MSEKLSSFPLSKIPKELQIITFELAPASVQAALAATSRWANNIVTPILYRNISIHSGLSNAMFLRTLIENPSLARHVQSIYRGRINQRYSLPTNIARQLEMTLDDMFDVALDSCVNLTTLSMHTEHGYLFPDSYLWIRALLARPSFTLRKLVVRSATLEVVDTRNWNIWLTSTLVAQPMIEYLDVPGLRQDLAYLDAFEASLEREPLLRAAVPNLSTLKATHLSTFEALSAGSDRPFKSLGFRDMSTHDFFDHALPSIPYPSFITELEWSTVLTASLDLVTLFQAFPSLRTLRLKLSSYLPPGANQDFFFDRLPTALELLKNLDELDLDGSLVLHPERESTTRAAVTECFSDHLQKFGSKCPTLRCIILPDSQVWRRRGSALAWERISLGTR